MTAPCPDETIRITVNGGLRQAPPVTVGQYLADLGMAGRRIAVELNRELLPRDRHDGTLLRDGDHLEVVSFVGGG